MVAIAWATTVLMGMVLGLLGGGGSILTVPILVYLFSVEPIRATSYSLFIVGCSAAFAVSGYMRAGMVQWRVAFTFALPAFLGVSLARQWLLPAIPNFFEIFGVELSKGSLVLFVFAIVMLGAANKMIRSRRQVSATGRVTGLRAYLWIGVVGLVVGFVTGFVGAGGGFLIVPALAFFAGLDMKQAVATSLLIISMNSAVGFLGDLTNFQMDWLFLMKFLGFAIVGIAFGVRLNKHVPASMLRVGFGWFTLVMAVFILSREIF